MESNLAKEIVKLLNELKPKKFDFSNLDMKDENIPKIIEQIVGKAINEPQSTKSYALLTLNILHSLPGGYKKTFKSTLLTLSQKRFSCVINSEIDQKISLGVIRFVGELFNTDFLSASRIQCCLMSLLKNEFPPSFNHLQCFELLLTVTGKKLEVHNTEIVEQVMNEVEGIVDRCGGKNLDKESRILIVNLFKTRATGWEYLEEAENEEIFNVIKNVSDEYKTPLKKLDETLRQVTSDNMHEFMNGLLRIESQLSEGDCQKLVRLILLRGSEGDSFLFAFICKTIANFSSKISNKFGEKFKNEFLRIFTQEFSFLANNSLKFRNTDLFLMQLKNVKNPDLTREKLNELKVVTSKAEMLVKTFGFLGELYNNEFLESDEILKYLEKLSSIDVLTNVTIGCYDALFQSVLPKILSEKVLSSSLVLETFKKLYERSKDIQMSTRSQFIIQNLVSRTRLSLDFEVNEDNKHDNYIQFQSPIGTEFSKEPLW